jgi:D-3-phosphoglycerate dehydrogenase / 2-oxoglutarate reductase
MKEIKILANDGIDPIGKKMLEDQGYSVSTDTISQDQLPAHLKEYDVIIVRSATKVRQELIDTAPNLKIIGRGGVGMDNIDVEYARSKGITVINTPAASSNSVAELVFAHLLSAIRFLSQTNRIMPTEGGERFKELKKSSSTGRELYGKTLGIIGLGRIGQETARIALGLGMNVVAFDAMLDEAEIKLKFHPALNMNPQSIVIKCQTKEAVLAQSDFVSLHVPGGGKTVIGEKEISQMRDGAVLVNCARGGVIDEHALNSALNSGKLAFAALDVFETEPPVYKEILLHDNISLSPHIGAATVEAQARIGVELAEKIIATFNS